MRQKDKTKEQLSDALAALRRRIGEAEKFEAACRLAEEQAAVIAEIGRIIGSTLHIDEVYERFAAEARKLIPCDRLTVCLHDLTRGVVRIAYISDRRAFQKKRDTFPLTGSLNEAAGRSRAGMILHPQNLQELAKQFPTLVDSYRAGMRSFMSVPLIYRDAVIGTLNFRSQTPSVYGEQELQLAHRIGNQIAGAIANAELFAELSRAERSFRESEARFRPLFEQMAVGVGEIDLRTGRYLSVNRRLAEILGTTEAELLAKTFLTITDPEDIHLHEEKMARLIAGAIPNYTLEKRYLRKDGEVIWVNVTVSPLWRPWEKPERIITVIEDISERKRTERETATLAEIGRLVGSTLNIHEVYEQFTAEVRKLLPTDQLAVSLYDLRNKLTRMAYLSDATPTRKTGDIIPLAGTIHTPILQTRRGVLMNPRDIEELAEFPAMSMSFRNGTRSYMSVPLFSRDEIIGALSFRSKTPFTYKGKDLPLAQRIANQIAGAIANAELFSELKRTEGSLRESEARYRELIDLLPIPIFEVDAAARVTTFNRTALEVFGYEERDAEGGISASRFFSPEEQERLAGQWQRILKEAVVTPGQEFTFVRKAGSAFTGLIYSSPILHEGRFAGVRGAVIDLTARKRLEEERQKLEERLTRAEKMEALGTLAGGVAHDLNNVLGVLVGYAELLQEKIPEESPLRRYAGHILQSGLKGAAIIQDLLTLARRGVAISAVTNLNRVVTEYLQSPEFENLKLFHPGVDFRVELEPDLLNIRGSPVHLGKTVMNLLANAAEAIAGSGEVTIRTENRYLDRPVRGYDEIQAGDYVLLSVTDSGKGIATADIGKIFEPFYTKKVMGRSGTGLGLAVVWGTVRDHDGYVDVQSELEKGSAFTLYFPVTREALPQAPAAADASAWLGKGETILVVDDVLEQRELAVSLLTRLGYRAAAAASGEEALERLRTEEVDLLVLDMIMEPGMDGLETYQQVLAIRPGQKAVIVSGFSETERVKEAQALGAGAYVRKPYVLEKIGLAIRAELDKGASAAGRGA